MTFKRKFRNVFLFVMPFLIFVSAIVFSRVFARDGAKAALVLAGTQMPSESVSIIFDELEGGTDEEIQSVIDNLNIPEDKPGAAVFVDGNLSPTKSNVTTNTPSDITALIENAKVIQANAKKSGSIKEVKYTAQNATNAYNNVSIRNTTSKNVDIAASLEAKCKLEIHSKTEPTVLIFHTHTTESYEMLDRGWYSNEFPTRSSDEKTNMVRVGNALCDSLSASGYSVIHDKQIYDTSYSGSYARSRKAIEEYKTQYPSIQVIIDVHRDGIKTADGTKTKPVSVINDKKCAQIMIIAGCEDGSVKSFPNWQDNLNFAIQLQGHAESLYPGLMRPIYFCGRRYNMDTSTCGILLEVGSDANTLEEAVYSGTLIGSALGSLLNAYAK